MGLTENQKRLIDAVSSNDIKKAKKCAMACLAEDTTSKNSNFCKRYRNILESGGPELIALPQNLNGIVRMEDVSGSFIERRYFLSDREDQVFQEILRMQKVSQKLLQLRIPYLNTTLLYGESGTGKTTFGRYVAYKTGLPFCYLNFSQLVDSLMGNTSKNISKAFEYAAANPCVFMLDEIDCISIRRSSGGSGGSDGEMARVTISLMQEFDRLSNNMIIIGATNRIDRVDEALLRRFSVKHEVVPLKEEEKELFVRKYISDTGLTLSEEAIAEIIQSGENQAMLVNLIIKALAKEIENSEI